MSRQHTAEKSRRFAARKKIVMGTHACAPSLKAIKGSSDQP